ncbi:MAG: hydantoinase/oxoprolinase family protein [Actinobacteria bacterium]|nr:hydantoinase/oxoprolinase family protein [Actinomycetota bacterium]
MGFTITVDTGGTFTDVVLADEQELLGLYKASTTPHDPFEAVEAGIRLAAEARGADIAALLADTSTFVYATTHSTNAILQGKTAKTAFLTTEGHPDILLFREGGKPNAFDFTIETPAPYIPRSLTFEVGERVLSDGSVDVPLDEERLMATLDRLVELDVEAVAVCLLWSIVNPVHEQRVGELIEERLPGMKYSLGHAVNPILREYRRAAATALDASIKPLMQTHLEDFEQRLRDLGFAGTPLMVTHVTGGVLHFAEMIARPLYTVDSGPVMAPVAAQAYLSQEPAGFGEDAIIVDTGGTSFDVSLLRSRELVYAREKWLGQRYIGHMTGLPTVDCQSIGAGGGSIAWVDPGGLLRVGPESAGAVPGPAAYGKGDRPTVTDAAVALGYIDPDFFLGGAMTLDVEASRRVIERDIARPLGLNVLRAAYGILVVAAEEMQKLTLAMTVGQGLDPRECVLVAGGGASGLLATLIAQALGISKVLIPNMAAGLSATGAQYPDLIADFQRTVFTDTDDFDAAGVGSALADLDAEIDGFFAELGRSEAERREYICEARYANQVWELDVPFERDPAGAAPSPTALMDGFDAVHERVFAVKQPGAVVECLNWRGRARRVRDKPALGRPADNVERTAPAVVRGEREAYFDGPGLITASVAFGPALEQGEAIEGPAIVQEWATTIVLSQGSKLSVTELGNYLIEIQSR